MIGFCAFIVTYTYETGTWLPCTSRLQSMITKHGSGSKRTYVGIVAPPYLNFALHVIQSRIIFKVGLTRMNQTKRDLVDPDDLRDPTWFKLWYRITCAVKAMLT